MGYQNSFGKFIDGGRGFAITTVNSVPFNDTYLPYADGTTFDVVIGL